MYWVYAIRNKFDKIYIGQTEDLSERLQRHNGIKKNAAKSFTSKNKGPWLLFYKEKFFTRKEAVIREKELKSYQGRKFLKNLPR